MSDEQLPPVPESIPTANQTQRTVRIVAESAAQTATAVAATAVAHASTRRTWIDAVVDVAALGGVIAFVLSGKLEGSVGAMIIVAIAGVRLGALARSLPPGGGGASGAVMIVGTELLNIFRGRG